MRGALLIAGTTSNAGKSTVTAGLCRLLARRGISVAPFKAQNMSRNSTIAPDGAEISIAQAQQAFAAGIPPEAAMNPVLLKPTSEVGSDVIVRGRHYAHASAQQYGELMPDLRAIVADCLADLRQRFDVVICEGAGSPAEINLRERDLVNMGLARAADIPVVVVGDVDRGGVFASLFGTLAVLDPADQQHIAAFIINKFRGDAALLDPGVEQLAAMTGRPSLGVLPHLGALDLLAEDSLDARPVGPGGAAHAPDDATRDRELDRLADALERHLDIDAVFELIRAGAPNALPVLTATLLSPV